MLLRHNGTTLFIGLSFPLTDLSESGMELAIQQSIAKPVADSPHAILWVSIHGD